MSEIKIDNVEQALYNTIYSGTVDNAIWMLLNDLVPQQFMSEPDERVKSGSVGSLYNSRVWNTERAISIPHEQDVIDEVRDYLQNTIRILLQPVVVPMSLDKLRQHKEEFNRAFYPKEG